MRRIILITLFVSFLALSIVSALDTEIHVKTIRENKVSIFVYKSGIVPPLLLNSYHINSGPTGEVSKIYTGTEETLDVKVQVSKDGKTIYLERFDVYTAGKPIYIQLLSENISRDYMAGASAASSVTATNTSSNSSANTSESSSTGSTAAPPVTATNTSSKNPTTALASMQIKYYILEAVVIALIILLIIKLRSQNSSQPAPKKIKLPEDKDSLKNALFQSQKKIRELESQLNSIKNHEKIKSMEVQLQAEKREMERKLEDKRKELERMKRGY